MPAGRDLPDFTLHIGSGKTGTSSIQHLLDRNRQRLLELGVLYPRTPGAARHVRFGLHLLPDEQLVAMRQYRRSGFDTPAQFRADVASQLLTEVATSGSPGVLLSDEALYGLPVAALERLRRFTDRHAGRVRVVCYLRRQDDHLVSRYQQVVKIGETRRLAERTRQTDFSQTYDYHARLLAWDRVVEPDSTVVRPFEPHAFVAGSLYEDFFDAAGVDVPVQSLCQVSQRNQSLDADAVEFLRIVNLYKVEQTGATPGSVNNRALVTKLAAASSGPTLTLPEPVLDDFMDRWEESNRATARQFLGRDVLFTAPRKTRNTTTAQCLDPDRLDHLLDVAELPRRMHAPLRALAERELRGS